MLGLVVLLLGCGGDPLECRKCEEGEICVGQLDDADTDFGDAHCEALPEACAPALDCEDNTCVLAAFALCDPGSEGSVCDSEAPTPLVCRGGP